MEKRLFLAIALSFLVIYSFSRFTSRQENPEPVSAPAVTQIIDQPPVQLTATIENTQPVAKERITRSTALLELLLDQPSNTINSLFFKKYGNAEFQLFNSLALNLPGLVLIGSESIEDGFINNYKSGEVEIVQKFVFNSNYSNELKIVIKNVSAASQTITLPVALGRFDFAQKSAQPANTNIQDVTVSTPEKVSYPSPRKEGHFSDINFLAMRNKYFVALIDPKDQGFAAYIKPYSSQLVDVGIVSEQIALAPGQSKEFNFSVYFGPQDVDILNKSDLSWSSVVYYGKFNFFAHILLSALKFTNKVINNWGIAIIVVSMLIYFLLFPLTLKGFRTMKLTQELKPKIDQLQAQYKGDPQKLNREMIELYKEHKINPLSGCLPFMLQIPIFGAFFLVLSRLIEIKGANFLWIKDLSEPDRLFTLGQGIPFVGKDINALPVIFMVISFIQQRFTPAASGASAEQQKIFMVMTPVILGVVFYHMAAGLLLYSCVNAALMVFQMSLMSKKA